MAPRPVHDDRVPILIGGGSAAAIRRGVTWAEGWTLGGAPPQYAGAYFEQVRAAWKEAGRSGEPRLAALTYFSIGDDAEEASRAYLHDYYGFLGPYADQIAEGALRTPEAIRDVVAGFADAGCTELYFDPTTSSVDQVDRLAELVL
jgi:alkanesulfonate monooxygenase SsuD/methylene tetrahydromethanopterin reductase-like flavin-dependent oxidoreductase (luciferase family)